MIDTIREALDAVLARPTRTALTALGTLLGIAALVATVGLASTAGAQIVGRFDELAATTVTVTAAQTDRQPVAQDPIPWDAQERLQRLNGVRAAGTRTELKSLTGVAIHTTTVVDPTRPASVQAPVIAASPGLLAAVRGSVRFGRWLDRGQDMRADQVAVLGRTLASKVHLAALTRRPVIFLGDRPFTVIGVVDHVERDPALLDAVILPNGVARATYALASPTSVIVDTKVGAAALIARQAPVALVPQAPESVIALRPSEPAVVRGKVASDVKSMFLLLGLISLVIGGVGIANTTLVSVLERTSEIGLRRSLGATRSSIAGQFACESAAIGTFGGILGASAGVIVVVAVSAIQQWRPVLDSWLPPAAALSGLLIGLAAGAYPAVRAARIQPIGALRSDF